MRFKGSKNAVRMFSIKCSVPENKLTNIVGKLAKTYFYIGIYNIENKKLLDFFLQNRESKIIKCQARKESTDIIVKYRKSMFSSDIGLLFDCEAEVIVFYFTDSSIFFEMIGMNKYSLDQMSVISQGICSIACTWVTNNYELFFHYNKTAFPVEIKEDI